MVVLDALPGLSVCVHVAGTPAAEFTNPDSTDDERQRHATRYIEAISGAEFDVQWTFRAAEFRYRNWAINGLVYVDGKYADGRIFRPDAIPRTQDAFTVRMAGVWKKERGRYVERPMVFEGLMVDEAGQSAQGVKKGKVERLGEIEVRFYRGKAVPSVREGSRRAFGTVEKVPEKALKGRAVSHQASLGKARASSAWMTWEFEYEDYVDEKRHPFATFTFKYRSRKALQAECIIDRSPTPVPLEERPIEELTPDELRELVRRQRERDVAQQAVKLEAKRERESSSLTLGSIPTSEWDSDVEISEGPSRKRQRTGPVEVIDLCDESD